MSKGPRSIRGVYIHPAIYHPSPSGTNKPLPWLHRYGIRDQHTLPGGIARLASTPDRHHQFFYFSRPISHPPTSYSLDGKVYRSRSVLCGESRIHSSGSYNTNVSQQPYQFLQHTSQSVHQSSAPFQESRQSASRSVVFVHQCGFDPSGLDIEGKLQELVFFQQRWSLWRAD